MQKLKCTECGHDIYDEGEHDGVLIDGKPCKAWNFPEYVARRVAILEATNDALVIDNQMYHAFHETEKTMRQFAEEDIGKFKRIFGRFYWLTK